MKTILVTGDFIICHNIKKTKSLNWSGNNRADTVINTQPGGGWFIKELLNLMYKKENINIITPQYTDSADKGYQIWSKFNNIWRIEGFLGNELNENNEQIYSGFYPELTKNEYPDTIFIDDLGLNFAENEKIIVSLLDYLNSCTDIILKTKTHKYNSRLWNTLKQYNLLDKTTVVTTSDSLRKGGANISRSLSWDKTIEDTAEELKNGYFNDVFKNCKRIIILYDKFGIGCFTTKSQTNRFSGTDIHEGKLSFEKFVYDTKNYEGAWENKNEGFLCGSLSLLATASTLINNQQKLSISYIFKMVLSSIHKYHEYGGGTGLQIDFSESKKFIKELFNFHQLSPVEAELNNKEILKNLKQFYSAYPKYYKLAEYGLKEIRSRFQSNILVDYCGKGEEFLYAKAFEIIITGHKNALKPVPMASYGKYFTFDRDEIERINFIQNLINTYQVNLTDKRPLSFAVFGAPGSGKSFAIKELLNTIFRTAKDLLVFNLTQIHDINDLYQAFNLVQNSAVKGVLPLVFWDEFDNMDNMWLKDFLAPMQDGEYNNNGINHTIGRAIFVFAGGTCNSFEEYESKVHKTEGIKGPDFISRLRGYVNIKGPNPEIQPNNIKSSDYAYLIRRALLIRFHLETHHRGIFDADFIPSINPGVINALLKTKEYKHGSRSVESIISSSYTESNNHFGFSSLPSPQLLNIHADGDFMTLIDEGELENDFIELIAASAHQYWMEEKKNQGYKFGPTRNDKGENKTHPQLIPYNKLDEEWKERNRKTARLTKAKFAKIGYSLIPKFKQEANDLDITSIIEKNKTNLLNIEHEIWLRGQLIEGYEYNEITNDDLLLHKDITTTGKLLNSAEIKLDEAIIEATQKALVESGYKLRLIK